MSSSESTNHHKIIILRHGETEWSKSLKHTSSTDVALTKTGEQTAIELAKTFKDMANLTVFSSPRLRATTTAKLVFPGHKVNIVEELREWEYGDYEGITTHEIHQSRPDWNLWVDGCPNGESPQQVANRAHEVLRLCAETKTDVCLVAHGHILRVLTARYLDCAAQFGSHLLLSTGTVGILGKEHDRPTIDLWNARSFI